MDHSDFVVYIFMGNSIGHNGVKSKPDKYHYLIDKPLSFWLLLFETGTENVIITTDRRQSKTLMLSTNVD